MATESLSHSIGWIGTGRMGFAIVSRLLEAGADVWVYNRTRAKAEPLQDKGAKVVDSPAELAEREIVFTMVGGNADVLEVAFGPRGVLSRGGVAPGILVDATTIDSATSHELQQRAAAVGTAVLAAPVSGNPKVVRSGRLTVVASGPRAAYDTALPYLEQFGRKVTYVGDSDQARLVKICHNLMLGIVSQTMAEVLVLAEAGGVSRADCLEFLNDSVMGSMFTNYKTPAYVNLDFSPTFTWHLLRKDFELGLTEGRERNVPLPTAAAVHQIIVSGIGRGYGDQDFASLLRLEAEGAGRTVEPENRDVSDGLS